MGWSEAISLTSRILTRSPTVNRQSMAWLSAPVVRSRNRQCMVALVVWRLTSTMSSSHSMPSRAPVAHAGVVHAAVVHTRCGPSRRDPSGRMSARS